MTCQVGKCGIWRCAGCSTQQIFEQTWWIDEEEVMTQNIKTIHVEKCEDCPCMGLLAKLQQEVTAAQAEIERLEGVTKTLSTPTRPHM